MKLRQTKTQKTEIIIVDVLNQEYSSCILLNAHN